MRFSRALIHISKEAKQFDSANATLLQKGAFIHQVMAGVYAFLPLGLRVLTKIEDIVREEMDKIASELLLPTLSPRSLWETTNRTGIDILLEAKGANEASQQKNDAGYIVNPTHEEVITPIVHSMKSSYKDFPFAVYQIQTKFRNEERPKSGLLRGREFRMKDLYSFHTSNEDRKEYYERVKEAYKTIFDRIGLGKDTVVALASGGDFSREYSEEFQTVCDAGEDTIYVDKESGVAYNKEVFAEKDVDKYEVHSACEVGNIFNLGTFFPESFQYTHTDAAGERKPIYMSSYGIGTSRAMGVLVEKFHDERGIIWPEAVAPFHVHLVGLNLDDTDVRQQAEHVYEQLQKGGMDVLFDDRIQASPGEKFADADLIGIPWRLVVSKKTGDQVEIKRRNQQETKLVPVSDVTSFVSTF